MDFETFITTIDTVKVLTDDGRLIGAENFLVSGENLLKWLRFRGYTLGDRRRCQRHQLFIKRVLEYAQSIYNSKPALFSQVVKTCLKITETDLTYEHVAELLETYKNLNLETNLERFVLPGYADSRYRNSNGVARSVYEEKNMPNFNAQVMAAGLTGDEAEKRKVELVNGWRKEQVLVSYYIPKYDWPLETYIKWFREHDVQMNYEEVDTLRK